MSKPKSIWLNPNQVTRKMSQTFKEYKQYVCSDTHRDGWLEYVKKESKPKVIKKAQQND